MSAKPVKCICGRTPKVMEDFRTRGNVFFVRCSRKGCWEGPIRSRSRNAVRAWDRLMHLTQWQKPGVNKKDWNLHVEPMSPVKSIFEALYDQDFDEALSAYEKRKLFKQCQEDQP